MERFMELYESVYQDLYRLAYYYLGNAQDAEDAVGDAVLKAYENFSSLRKKDSFRPWIFKILINQCNLLLRKKITRGTAELMEEPSYRPELGDRVFIREMMMTLSAEERRIVLLTVFGGYKGEEIARILKKPHSTIRSKYRRALKKLEEQILTAEVQYEKKRT